MIPLNCKPISDVEKFGEMVYGFQDPHRGSKALNIHVLNRPRGPAKTKPEPSFQLWNKDSSSKNLITRLQKIWRNYLNMKKYKVGMEEIMLSEIETHSLNQQG